MSTPTQHNTSPTRRRRRWVIALATITAVVVGAGLVTSRLHHRASSWTPIWQDTFTGAAGAPPSATNWLTDTGTSYPGGAAQWGTGEQETYTADRSNVALDGHGDLRLTATRDGDGTWRSGRLETTRTDFQPAPGGQLRVAARIETPGGGSGYWPAFWMLGAGFRGVYTNWPGIGEIDIMEVSGGVPRTVHGTLHCGVDPGGPCNETNGISGQKTMATALSSGFHTYAVEWDRSHPVEAIRWYVDGHLYFTARADQMDAATWAAATHHGFFVLLDLAIGGSFPGPTDAATTPGAAMLVDYVTVSRR